MDEALTELASKHPEKAELVKLRYFAGLTLRKRRLCGVSPSLRQSAAGDLHVPGLPANSAMRTITGKPDEPFATSQGILILVFRAIGALLKVGTFRSQAQGSEMGGAVKYTPR